MKKETLVYSSRHRRIKPTKSKDRQLLEKMTAYYGKEEAFTQFQLFKLKMAVKSSEKFQTL